MFIFDHNIEHADSITPEDVNNQEKHPETSATRATTNVDATNGNGDNANPTNRNRQPRRRRNVETNLHQAVRLPWQRLPKVRTLQADHRVIHCRGRKKGHNPPTTDRDDSCQQDRRSTLRYPSSVNSLRAPGTKLRSVKPALSLSDARENA